METAISWVVYLMSQTNKDPVKAVCEQSEWDAMELRRPGINKLVQAGFSSEGAAERVARGEPVIISKLWPPSRA
jgi:hypothetical protein